MVLATLVAAGSAYWLNARERKPWPKPTPPPPASPIFHPSPEPAPTAEEIALQSEQHNQQLVVAVERALVARDAQQRETAFTFLLPELIQVAPGMVTDMVARQEPGEARDTLRDEVARQWIVKDRDAAVAWIKTLGEAERKASANIAVGAIAAASPAEAIAAADELDVGRHDGSLERLVQRWATEDLAAALEWIGRQPPGPRTDQLRARIEHVRSQTAPATP